MEQEVPDAPGDRRNRELTLGELLGLLGVRPGHELAVGAQEGLDREAAGRDLEPAVFVEQRLLGSRIRADDRPVALLAGEIARIEAAR